MKKVLLLISLFGILVSGCSPETFVVTGQVEAVTHGTGYNAINFQVDSCSNRGDDQACRWILGKGLLYFPKPSEADQVKPGDNLKLICLTVRAGMDISTDGCDIVEINPATE